MFLNFPSLTPLKMGRIEKKPRVFLLALLKDSANDLLYLPPQKKNDAQAEFELQTSMHQAISLPLHHGRRVLKTDVNQILNLISF